MYSNDDNNGLGALGNALLSQQTGNSGMSSIITQMLQTYMKAGMNDPNNTPDPFGMFSGKTVDTGQPGASLGMMQPPMNSNDVWNWKD
jgi:hypothetical protein